MHPRGALAQLGERRLCKAEVIGSIPIRSTSPPRRCGQAAGKLTGVPSSWVPRAGRDRSLDAVVLAGIVAVAAATRFSWLDLMEFKGDEAQACRLALHVLGFSEPGVGRFFPTEGLISSIGVPNPPLFVYLVSLPLLIVRSPLAAVTAIAAANVTAVGLCYVVGKRCFSRFVGLAGAALWSLAPWAIVFSRKIWAQDLLPICTTLFALELHALLVRRKPSAVFWLLALLAIATQLHFSAWVLAPVVAASLWLGRDIVERRFVGLGIVFAAVLYLPFLVDHAGAIVHASHHKATTHAPDLLARFEAAFRFTLAIVGGDTMSILLGRQSPLARPLSIVAGTAALLGIVLAARSARDPAVRRLRLLFLCWYLLPLTLLTLVPVHDYIHYFIVITPLPFLGLAHVAEMIVRRRAAAGLLALACCLAAFAAIDVRYFSTVIHDGGAPGDYGIAYRYKAEAVAAIVRANPRRAVRVGLDERFQPSRKLRDIRFLLWNARIDSGAVDLPATTGYVFVDRLDTRTPTPRAGTLSFGPLEVRVLPLRAGASASGEP